MSKKIINFQAAAWKPLVLASAISSLFVPNVYAADDEVKSLAPVVVTASRIEQPQTEALPHTTVITKEEIQNSGASDVLSLLHKEAGVEVAQTGGVGTQTSVFLRGTNSNQTLFLLDGVPIDDAASTGATAFLEHILSDQIERIEIVRGNVSAIYGSRAIGGVIQIFTKRGSGKPSLYFSAEAGSHGTNKVSGGVSGQSGETRYALSLARYETDGFSAMNTNQYTRENPDDDGAKNISVAASLSHEWQKGHELGARIYTHDSEFDYDNGGDGLTNVINSGTSKQDTYAIFSKNRFSPAWLSNITLSQSDIRRRDVTKDGAFGSSDYSYKGETRALQWANEVMLQPNWIMTAGISAARESADIKNWNTLDRSRSNNSVYAGVNGKIEKHSLQLNVRYDDVGDSGSDATYYLGYGYMLTSRWKLIASTSTAFLAPTLYQLYDATNGNPDLKAERALTNEVGAQYAIGKTLIRATLFDSRTRDQIDYVSGSGYVNVEKSKNHGFELSASSRILDIDIRASFTMQDPKDDTTGERLAKRAKKMASLALSKQMGAWRVGGDAQYVGHRRDASYNPATFTTTSITAPSYVVVNLNANYQINKEWSAFGRIENLLDKDYQTVYGYNQPSRGIFVGVRWSQ